MKLFICQYTVHRPSAAPRRGIRMPNVRLLGSHFGDELTFEFLCKSDLSLRLDGRKREGEADL